MIEYRGKRYPIAAGFQDAGGSPEAYTAWLLDLPGCIVQGASQAEARDRLTALGPQYLQALEGRGLTLPEPTAVPAIQARWVGFYHSATGNFHWRPGRMEEEAQLVG